MTTRTTPLLIATLVAMSLCASAMADVSLPKVFGDHMVLQRDVNIPVWGKAAPGEDVTVTLGSQAPVATKAGDDGKWRVDLPPIGAGGPLELKVSGANEIVFTDVLIGEVWLCSGQSNMQWTVGSSLNPAEEIANANFPQIRHIAIPRVPQGFPVDDVNANWTVCSPETVGGYTAAGYFMARELHEELGVPVGLLNSSWGGTRIEPWTPPVGFAAVPALKDISDQLTLKTPTSPEYKQALGEYLGTLDQWLATAKTALADETPLAPSPAYPTTIAPFLEHQQPTTLYNGMIHALVPYAIRGAIWYQGESNHGEGALYTEKMKALITGWREVWRQGDFPFYYVQIAPYVYGNEDPNILPIFWEAQTAAMAMPNTGQVVIHDVGDLNDIHPKNKQAVGKRLALWALANDYGRDLVYTGPIYRSMAIEGDKIRVSFDHTGSGLASRDGEALDWFEIIGPETDFVKASAVIDGDTVLVSAPEVKQPAAVRFAWHRDAAPNLMNKEGLPANPFRAGEVPKIDYLKTKVAESADFKLAYELDLAKLGRDISYDVDNSADLAGGFDRVAYYLELKVSGKRPEFVYVSMDAFTDDIKKIGIPAIGTGALFQTKVANLNVVSNVHGIVQGEGLTGGNIEFWSYNYGPPNAAQIPGASAAIWDFGDQYGAPEDGYGCMQVHNFEAKQTLFSINAWKSGGSADLGIGNFTGDNPDWTFAHNAATYESKVLKVLVHPK